MKQIRQFHLYLGTFFAPAIFFFAFSGALQTFGLHESGKGSSYSPPAWIATMAEIHRDQRLEKPHKEHAHAVAPKDDHDAHEEHAQNPALDDDHQEPRSSLPLKCFILLLSVGLMTAAGLGIYIALQSRNNRRITWVMLASGVMVPVALLFL